MSTTENCRMRFLYNNFAELITSSIDFSSELSSFPFTNVINRFRSKLWIPSGAFIIDSTNDQIYINDGADKTVSLTNATYTTPALMATHIQTQLNASSANWTVTHNNVAGTYKFIISNSGSVTLRLSQTTNAAWTTLGYKLSTDQTGTSFTADEQRNHYPYEYATFDMGFNAPITFFALIGPLDEVFTLSDAANVTLKANNLNQNWDSPPFSQTITRQDGGLFRHLTDYSDTSYRYWRIEIEDMYNPLGPEGLKFGHLFIGDEYTFTANNLSEEFQKIITDPSTRQESDNGTLYFNKRTKYTSFDNMVVRYTDKTVRKELEDIFDLLGTTTPFYISLDPTLNISTKLEEFTKYVVFETPPQFNHVFRDLFTVAFRLREVL